MKKLSYWFLWLFFISVFSVPSVYAIGSKKQSFENPYENECSAKRVPLLIAADPSGQQDPYAQAEELYKEKKYGEVIKLLYGPAYDNPSDFRINILLAKAQLSQCAILKANGNKSYKTLVQQPYVTGRRLHKIDETRPEPYYIVAKALLINNRLDRSIRTIKKALYYSPDNPEYLIILGDGYSALGDHEYRLGEKQRFFRIAKDAYEKALKFGKDIPELNTVIEQRIDELSKKLEGDEKQDLSR
jgi:tetratricopeptide (TPR) repeat protein